MAVNVADFLLVEAESEGFTPAFVLIGEMKHSRTYIRGGVMEALHIWSTLGCPNGDAAPPSLAMFFFAQ